MTCGNRSTATHICSRSIDEYAKSVTCLELLGVRESFYFRLAVFTRIYDGIANSLASIFAARSAAISTARNADAEPSSATSMRSIYASSRLDAGMTERDNLTEQLRGIKNGSILRQ